MAIIKAGAKICYTERFLKTTWNVECGMKRFALGGTCGRAALCCLTGCLAPVKTPRPVDA